MSKRCVFVGLAASALIGIMASEARAEVMTLTVYLNSTSIYTVGGASEAVSADPGILNVALAGSGYTVISLSGASNFPGTTGLAGGFISVTGTLGVGSGTGGTLQIVVSENGFTAPPPGQGASITSEATATFPISVTTHQFTSTFADSSPTPVTVTTPTLTLTSGITAGTLPIPLPAVFSLPYTLSSTTTIVDPSGTANTDVFVGTVSVSTVPEPASLVMLLTGISPPLAAWGWLRGRGRGRPAPSMRRVQSVKRP